MDPLKNKCVLILYMKHKSIDYKLSAINHYLNSNDGYQKTCKIFGCTKPTLIRWISKFKQTKNVEKISKVNISYKVANKHVEYGLKILKKRPSMSMMELNKTIRKKYPEFIITSQHLGQVIRDNNFTRKRTVHRHYPKERYGKPVNLKNDMKKFYSVVGKYSILSNPMRNSSDGRILAGFCRKEIRIFDSNFLILKDNFEKVIFSGAP